MGARAWLERERESRLREDKFRKRNVVAVERDGLYGWVEGVNGVRYNRHLLL
jgi:hypothetical protein